MRSWEDQADTHLEVRERAVRMVLEKQAEHDIPVGRDRETCFGEAAPDAGGSEVVPVDLAGYFECLETHNDRLQFRTHSYPG